MRFASRYCRCLPLCDVQSQYLLAPVHILITKHISHSARLILWVTFQLLECFIYGSVCVIVNLLPPFRCIYVIMGVREHSLIVSAESAINSTVILCAVQVLQLCSDFVCKYKKKWLSFMLRLVIVGKLCGLVWYDVVSRHVLVCIAWRGVGSGVEKCVIDI